MPSRRAQKVAQAVREVVSMAILAELKDPRVRDVTVTYVEVSGDLRHAKVHVSVMGEEAKQQLSLRGLRSAAGFLQSKLASRIDTRYTPRLDFILDQGVKKSIAIAQILDRVLPGPPEPEGAEGDEDHQTPEQPLSTAEPAQVPLEASGPEADQAQDAEGGRPPAP